MSKEPIYFTDPDEMADYIIKKTGKNVAFGTQLALGKPNNIVNALYRKAKNDPSINLKIMTALSLEPPVCSSDLEQRMLGPIIERVWGGYVPLEYAEAARTGTLPPNVEVSEFFCKAGAFMQNDYMQQNYISTNYTFAARDVMAQGMNVVGALIGKRDIEGKTKISLGCNGDTTIDLIDYLSKKKNESGYSGCAVAEVNAGLPFMYGDALGDPSMFDAILENPAIETRLFGIPREAVSTVDYMIGLNSSTLVKDDGTIQIGIGSLGDGLATALIARQNRNFDYVDILNRSGVLENSSELIKKWGSTEIFEKGLYGSTEMFVDGLLQLYKNGIMKRRCYDNIHIQTAVNEGFGENGEVSPGLLSSLVKNGAVARKLTKDDFELLSEYGIFRKGLSFEDGHIITDSGRHGADLEDPESFKQICENCLGTSLEKGVWIHAGFYAGPQDFYDTIRLMPEEERMQINMTSVLNVNQLYSNNRYSSSELRVMQRKNSRFINTGLMVTLLGAVVSDGLENGRVISGVGGQYNFVSMAHAMDDARGIIMIRSTRGEGRNTASNIVFNYGHTTIPRHLRDIIVTEYGIADIRSKSDKEVIKALLNVADSRFQESLLSQAKKAGKIPNNYIIPERFRNNTPQSLEEIIEPSRRNGLFPAFPFGTDFTEEEIILGKALRTFKAKANENKISAAGDIIGSWFTPPPKEAEKYIERMRLDRPKNMKEKLMQKIVVSALQMTGAI